MLKTIQAYYNFWSSVIPGVPAFVEQTVPELQSMPYITYTLQQNSFGESAIHQARVWTQSTDYEQMANCLQIIEDKIPDAGVNLPVEGGVIIFYRGQPFIQKMPMEDPLLQVGYINIEAQFYII